MFLVCFSVAKRLTAFPNSYHIWLICKFFWTPGGMIYTQNTMIKNICPDKITLFVIDLHF